MWDSNGHEVSCALSVYILTLADCLFSKGEAFRDDKWHWQTRMMDAMLTALDCALVGFTYVYFANPAPIRSSKTILLGSGTTIPTTMTIPAMTGTARTSLGLAGVAH